MPFAVGQMRVFGGDPSLNKETMLGMIQDAKSVGAELILFPELAIPGLLTGDLKDMGAFLDDCNDAAMEIAAASQGIKVIFGSYDDDHGVLENAVFMAENGELTRLDVPVGDSLVIGAYDQFRPASEARSYLLEIDGELLRTGFILGDWFGRPFPFDTGKLDLIIDLTARPVILNEDFNQKVNGCSYISVNAYGLQNSGKTNYIFYGSSEYRNAEGIVIAKANAFTEGLYIWTAEGGSVAAETDSDDQLIGALVSGVRCFCEQAFVNKAVIGISGGIDSALAACVYTQALGADNVYLVSMPTHFNSSSTKSLAERIAYGLGTHFAEIPIESCYQDLISQCESAVFKDRFGRESQIQFSPLAVENVMARERGRILMAVSSAVGGIFTCNGNKTELSVGYATFYGDLAGALACQADLWKFQVYEAAAAFQKKYPSLPLAEIAAIKPSAELSDAQSVDKGLGDPIIYPYHDYLLRWWVEKCADPTDTLYHYEQGDLEAVIGCKPGLIAESFSSTEAFIDDLERWWRQYRGMAVAKRIQSPPVLALSSCPFGEPVQQSQGRVYFSEYYKQMREQLLQK